MHGIVLLELKKYVEQTYGPSTWSALLLSAGLRGKLHHAMGDYPDEEVFALVGAACEATGRPPEDLLETFGRFIAPDLIATYSFLIQPGWDALDVLQNIETTIHTVVRARDGATPPVLEISRVHPDRLTIRYSSERRLCALAKGITMGVGDHFGTHLEVSESACMNRGATQCVLDVVRVRVVPPAPRVPEPGRARMG